MPGGEYLLNLIFISPFADGDIFGALLGILDLLPGLHLLLLEEGDTVGEKLRIVIESIGGLVSIEIKAAIKVY